MARKIIKQAKQATQGDLALPYTCTALYIRVSTVKQAEEGNSLAAQRKELYAYCAGQGWHVCPDHIYVDAGISGKSDDRPAFQAMMTAAQAGQIQRIVATKLDRIARNLKNLLQTVDELKQYGCALVIKKEQFDTSTAQGIFVLQMLGAVGQLERSMISERVQSGRVENASEGGYNGSRCPLGYAYSNEAFTIVSEQAETVRSIFAMFLSGKSLNAIAKALNEAGTQTAAGGKWYPATVGYILRNGQYAGFAQWDGVEVDGVYPAIIDKATYEAAHKRLQALRPGIQSESEIARRQAA
jgi:site-specific DNA recombinase